ncbi:glycosyl transferase family 2 [Arcticibacter pallidicorallinus]|uniref:Glycosyl transferase family 2 n=1 Tax=Arcticibacter pallidicorallinus TaxID=1259464 RepID=A0A2T0TRG7_9SPHI|nr:glycosyltransferase family 2 protein [Arcticibacter pallidicorallinus]PRY48312.1 glycosyl transferase family 2 [Arcticibacter pallidicorallinus]
MLLSFVIPTYNRASKVRRAINSVLGQIEDTTSTEIVVVDDGSTDGTADQLKSLVSEKRIRLITHTENSGVAAAKNTGILNSRNKYVVLLDSDDLLEDGGLIYLTGLLQDNDDCDLIFSGSRLLRNGALLYDPTFKGSKKYKDLLTCRIGEYLPICRSIVLKEFLLRDLRGFESITWLSIAKRGYKVFYDSTPIRSYDDEGDDRLSNRMGIIKNSEDMKRGYSIYLKEFGGDLKKYNLKEYLILNVKYLCYSIMQRAFVQ